MNHILWECEMPLLTARKEVYAWIKEGKKTIDVRKGRGRSGDVAVFQCGTSHLRLPIIKRETGMLTEVIRIDNFREVIPTAECLEDALHYIELIYGSCEGVFTAYYFRLIE